MRVVSNPTRVVRDREYTQKVPVKSMRMPPAVEKGLRELAAEAGEPWTVYMRRVLTEHVTASTGRYLDPNDLHQK